MTSLQSRCPISPRPATKSSRQAAGFAQLSPPPGGPANPAHPVAAKCQNGSTSVAFRSRDGAGNAAEIERIKRAPELRGDATTASSAALETQSIDPVYAHVAVRTPAKAGRYHEIFDWADRASPPKTGVHPRSGHESYPRSRGWHPRQTGQTCRRTRPCRCQATPAGLARRALPSVLQRR